MRYFIAQPYGIHIFCMTDRAEYTLRSRVSTRRVQSSRGYCAMRGDRVFIGVFDGRLGTRVHECTHAAHMILLHCGVATPSTDYGEAHAFLSEHIFDMTRLKDTSCPPKSST